MKKLTQLRIGLVMCVVEYSLLITDIWNHKFNITTIMLCMYWSFWTIYYWNQRGKKCQLRIVPLEKNTIEIGDLVQENGFPLSGIVSGITTCMVPGGKEYSPHAQLIQLVIISDDELKEGDMCLYREKKTIGKYNPLDEIDDMLAGFKRVFDDFGAKKVMVFQKDIPQEFIQTVIDGKTQDKDTVIVRKNKVFKDVSLWENDLLIGCWLLFACVLIGDLIMTVYKIFSTENEIGKLITVITGILLISPVFYYAMKFIIKHYKKVSSKK